MKIYTIGFTKKTAEEFFKILKENKIEQLVDIRLNNTSQLAGFTKKKDLEFFLKEIADIDYYYYDFLAPTKELRDLVSNWTVYTEKYLKLLNERNVLKKLDKEFFNQPTIFLCSEPNALNCHRCILAQYLQKYWDIKVVHL